MVRRPPLYCWPIPPKAVGGLVSQFPSLLVSLSPSISVSLSCLSASVRVSPCLGLSVCPCLSVFLHWSVSFCLSLLRVCLSHSLGLSVCRSGSGSLILTLDSSCIRSFLISCHLPFAQSWPSALMTSACPSPAMSRGGPVPRVADSLHLRVTCLFLLELRQSFHKHSLNTYCKPSTCRIPSPGLSRSHSRSTHRY